MPPPGISKKAVVTLWIALTLLLPVVYNLIKVRMGCYTGISFFQPAESRPRPGASPGSGPGTSSSDPCSSLHFNRWAEAKILLTLELLSLAGLIFYLRRCEVLEEASLRLEDPPRTEE